jgi:hypothetical protein
MTDEKPKTWQELGDEFHMMVGYCVAEWAGVDDELFRIFRECVGPHEQSAIIYYRTPGLDVRFGLTDEIVRSVLPKRPKKSGSHDHPSVRAWVAAKGDYPNLLGMRRRIAHHPIMIRQEPFRVGMAAGESPPSWFEIYVSQHEGLRKKSSNLPALRIDDLKTHLIAVNQLKGRLHRFFYDVLTKRAAVSLLQTLPPSSTKSQKAESSTKPQRRKLSPP